jgi:hypothetical protein
MKIYADIASIIDLRQGMLRYLNPDEDKVVEYLNSQDYYNRTMDDFSSIVDMERYRALEENPTSQIITLSTISHVLKIINNRFLDALHKEGRIDKEQHQFVVNIYPFKFTREEIETFERALRIKLDFDVDVRLIAMSNKDLHIDYLNQYGFDEVYIYKGTEWLNYNILTLTGNNRTYDFRVFTPTLYVKEDVRRHQVKHDLFSFLEMIVGFRLSFNFLPTLFYINVVSADVLISLLHDDFSKIPMEEIFKDDIQTLQASEK